MSESNYNWVCFECRFVTRQAKTSKNVPKCGFCNRDCICVGYKLDVPKKSDKKGWERLRKVTSEIELQNRERKRNYREVRIAQLTEEIEKLSDREENKDRTRLINALKEELDRLLQETNP